VQQLTPSLSAREKQKMVGREMGGGQ